MRTIIIFFALISMIAPLKTTYAQRIVRMGTPLVQQFTKSAYNAGNQNWSVTVSNEGVIYAGNTEGLLSYDGQYWNLHHLKNMSTIRSVKAAPDGKIYCGGYGEFGYWQRKKSGSMAYTSISSLLKDKKQLSNDEIWKILINGDNVYFHAFSQCYVYNTKEQKINIISAHGEPFLFPHQIDGQILFEQLPSGLHTLDGLDLRAVRDKDKLAGKHILCILPFDSTTYLIGTARHGLYKMNRQGEISLWEVPVNSLLIRAQINNGIYLYNGQYAFGTIQDGVIIINKQGEVIQHINKNNGLQNNTVLSIAKDRQDNIWVGLDNGIDRIEINSPLYFYTDWSGKIGTVYTSMIHQGKIYLGTNQGLFVSPWKGLHAYTPFDFKLIPNSDGQVWSLAVIHGQLLCGHNDGTFAVNDGGLTKISSVTGGWSFAIYDELPFFLQGNYTGIAQFAKNPQVHLVKKYPEIKEPVRFITGKSPYAYWIGDGQQVSLITFDKTMERLTSNIGSEQDTALQHIRFSGAYNLENNIVFTTDSGLYYYDDILKKIQSHQELNKQLGTFRHANKIICKGPSEYWFVNRSHIAKVSFGKQGHVQVDSTSLTLLRNRMMNHYENILPIDKDFFLIGLDNGFSIYNDRKKTDTIPLSPPLISGVWNIHTDMRLIDEDHIILPYQENSIRIAYASPYYSSSPLSYQYILEGYSDSWSPWDVATYKDFTNLPFGRYTFKIRSRSADGKQSTIMSFAFEVQTPWYYSWVAVGCYIIILVVLILLARKKIISWRQKKQFQLHRRLLEQQKVAIARQTEIAEQKLIKLKNKQLEDELKVKNRELANAATNIVYKNEMLNNLHTELKELKDTEGKKLGQEEMRKINKLIEDAHNDNRDWDIFERSFNEAHEDFFKKLKSDYPELVPNDLKLCAYLRLHMSSKEIASLLNITTRGVEIRRYRLRKKLGLHKDKNLTEFLLEL